MSKISEIFKKGKSPEKGAEGEGAVNPALVSDAPKKVTWKHFLIFTAVIVFMAAVVIVIASSSSNPVNRTRKNMDNALAISSSDLISAYSYPENADILYKNKYLKISGIKWLGYSSEGYQIFHIWNGAENVNLHNPVFDIRCVFPNTEYYRDLSPYYGMIFDVSVAGKCVGVVDGHIQMLDCILITDTE